MISRSFLCCSAALAALVPLAICTAAHAQSESAQQLYELPAQDLSQALRQVAARTGKNLIAPGNLVAGRRSAALSGRYTAEQAFAALLRGTGLSVRMVGGDFVVAAAVKSGSSTGVATTDKGRGDEIVVTGTNLRGAQPTSPVIVLTRKDIDRTGATAVDELMRTLPQNSSGGVNKENFLANLPDEDITDHGAGLNLRGLGQRATLVLVNGRRLAPSGSGSFVDVSLIPLTAVQRVEIVTDGASAIYGSDAVGGVVNFILRDRFNGLESAVQAGVATDGGGEQLQLSQTAGRSWSSGSAMLAYEYRLENEVRAGQRDFPIDLNPNTFLLPRERRHSLLATLEQDLVPGLHLGLTGTFAHRTTVRTLFESGSPLPVGMDARADSGSLAGDLRYELPHGWEARLDGNYALSADAERQTQPGGDLLVNARNVRNSILELGLKLDGSLFALPAGPVRLALGSDVRRERYRDAFESSSFPEVDRAAHRTVRSAFAELLVPVFSQSNSLPALRRLQLSAAARYDNYSHTGSRLDPKLGILWSPVRDLNLRASYSTSFRAPLLSEVSGAYTGLLVPAVYFYADPSKAPPGSIALVLQGSNPDVKPETSRNWSLGGDWSPATLPGFSLTFNYYSIRYSNRIALPTSVVNVIGDPAYASVFQVNPDVTAVARLMAAAQAVFDFSGPGFSNGGATPADVAVVLDDRIGNTAMTKTSGFDLGLKYAFSAGRSEFVAEANLNHIIAFDDQLTPASPLIQDFNRPYRPPAWRGRGGLSWTRGGWAGSLFANYGNAYPDDRDLLLRRRVRSSVTVDASLAYAFGQHGAGWLRGTRIALFAENLLDANPPRLVPDPGMATGIGYDPVNASARGRFVSVQLRRSW